MSLRVLVVTNMYPTPSAPLLGTFVGEQVASLRARGLVVDVLFIDGPASKLNYLHGFGRLRSALRSCTYDLIHAHYVFAGAIALSQRAVPVVLTHHGIEAQQGWTAPLCRLTSRLAAYTIATSPRVAAALHSARTKPTARLAVIPCGVDTDLFSPMGKREVRARLGYPAGQPLVLFVGAPRPEKRLPLIEAAVSRLQEELPDVRLVRVHNEPRERVALYMNACDVLVLASVAEGSPMVVREAMACNLPVVSTDVGDVAELLNGLPGNHICEPTAAALARHLGLALASGRQRDPFAGSTPGSSARDRIMPWSLAAVAAQIETIYRQVLASKAARSLETGS